MVNRTIFCRECAHWRQMSRTKGVCAKGMFSGLRFDHSAMKPSHCEEYESKYAGIGNGMLAEKGGE